jgi:REP element-mobilizing transposase RayT
MRLPHWQQEGRTYFITFRLGDSLPREKLNQWHDERKTWLRAHGLRSIEQFEKAPEKTRHEFHQRFTAQWHAWLDAGSGACVLRAPAVREIVVGVLLGNHGARYDLDAWVVMPNHAHVLLTPRGNWKLGVILQSWKGGSSRAINLHLGRSGSLWQSESYDHIVRSEEQLEHYRRYIADNPIKAKLREGEYALSK